jgi:cysteine desulfurase/selenocysteine lyase
MTGTTLRKHFPFFNRLAPTYLDNAATAHKPQAMIDAIGHFYSNQYATVHRGLYPSGESATARYEEARSLVAGLINAAPDEIIFTKGTTESINVVATAWALDNLNAGDEIVLTTAEHHANLLPWQVVAEKTGAQLIFVPIDTTTFEAEPLEKYYSAKTKLVAFTLSSNVIGALWEKPAIKKYIKTAHELGAKVLIDAAQAIAHEKIDTKDLDADFLAFSGHKLFGPTGIGVLYAKKDVQAVMTPYQYGGSMVYQASLTTATWQPGPQKFEAGTPPIAEVIGLGATIKYLNEHITSWQAVHHHEANLCKQALDGLQQMPDVIIIGNKHKIASEGHLISFVVKGVHAHDVASHLGASGITVRAGHLCAQPFVDSIGQGLLIRMSVAFYTTQDDISHFLTALSTTIAFFKTLG